MSELSSQQRVICHFVLLDAWHRHRLAEKTASHFSITKTRAQRLLDSPAFQTEVERLRLIYAGQGPASTIGEVQQRVGDLDELFRRIPPRRTSLRMRILARIAEEVGDRALS